jgi:hypothetical protein
VNSAIQILYRPKARELKRIGRLHLAVQDIDGDAGAVKVRVLADRRSGLAG